jgi:hypothetical protein
VFSENATHEKREPLKHVKNPAYAFSPYWTIRRDVMVSVGSVPFFISDDRREFAFDLFEFPL